MNDAETSADPAAIRRAAMDLLARREHAQAELRRKLGRRFADGDAVDAILDELAARKLQSDARFAESFARQRVQRGYGPLRVRREMREKGLPEEAIGEALAALEVDWFAQAAAVYERKFGTGAPADAKDRARRGRFMQYRGFTGEQIAELLAG